MRGTHQLYRWRHQEVRRMGSFFNNPSNPDASSAVRVVPQEASLSAPSHVTVRLEMRIASWNIASRRLIVACILLHISVSPGAEAAWTLGAPIFTYCTYPIPDSIAATVSKSYGWPVGYDPTTLTPEIARQAVLGGFNLVWINDLSQLAIAEHYGLRAQFVISGHQPQEKLFFQPDTNWPRAADVPAINALIDRFKKSPAAYSYFITDEPAAARFEHLAAIVSYLKRRDPAHLAYINLFPGDELTTDLGTADYATYLAEFIRTVHPALLSYDSYNLFEGNDRSLFLANMQTIARAAARNGIPFMAIVQGSRFGTKARVPTGSELRLLTNAPLAFGAQGISYFNYWTGFGPSAGGIASFPDGAPTKAYLSLRDLSPLFKRVAERLRGVQWIGTYVQGYTVASTPRYMAPSPDSSAFDVESPDRKVEYVDGAPLRGALVGYFGTGCAAPACATYVFIVNLDYSANRTYRVKGPALLSRFDASAGTWIPTGHNYVDLTLEGGGGALIGVTSVAH